MTDGHRDTPLVEPRVVLGFFLLAAHIVLDDGIPVTLFLLYTTLLVAYTIVAPAAAVIRARHVGNRIVLNPGDHILPFVVLAWMALLAFGEPGCRGLGCATYPGIALTLFTLCFCLVVMFDFIADIMDIIGALGRVMCWG